MSQHIVAASRSLGARVRLLGARLRQDAGEGVISAAIAVLIMAFLGAAMWIGFNTIWKDAEGNIQQQIDSIGG